MTMGERIKTLREEKELSQEALGKLVNVNRAAVNKWETGQVENLKRSTIKTLANIFKVTPCYLMCFDENTQTALNKAKQLEESHNEQENFKNNVYFLEQIERVYGNNSIQLLKYFTDLNALGKKKAIENLSDLIEISKYTEKEKTILKNA